MDAMGFLLSVGADTDEAQASISEMSKAVAETTAKSIGNFDKVNESLLNQHQSVHLLAEEMGIHLPRAVVGAIGEMLPSIGELGGALLGAFAVERVYEWAKSAADVIRETYGEVDQAVKDVGAAAEQVAKQTHDNVLKIYTDFKSTAAAVLPMEDVDAQAEKLKKYVQDFMELEKVGGDLRRLPAEAIREIGQAAKEGITNLDQARTKLNEVGALQYEEHKRLAELTKTEDHARCEAAIKDAKDLSKANDEALDALFRHEAGLARMHQYQIHQFVTLQENARAEAGLINTIIPTFRDLNQQIDTYIDRNRELMEVTVHLNAMRRMSIQISQDMATAAQHEVEAVSKHLLASTQELAGSVAGLIAGRRAQAAVEVPFEIAEGIKCLGEGTWPPNPAAIVAAGLHFEAAAQYAKIAGTSAHHRGGTGGSAGRGGYEGSERGYSGERRGDRDQSSPVTLAAGAAIPGGELHVHLMGSNDEALRWFANMVTNATQAGHSVVATSSQRSSPVGH